MRRKNGTARYPLPDPVNPESSTCLKMVIPDTREYRVAVRGQLYALSRAYVWGDDSEHTALSVASLMRDAYDTLEFGACADCPDLDWHLVASHVGSITLDEDLFNNPFVGSLNGWTAKLYTASFFGGSSSDLLILDAKADLDNSPVGGIFLEINVDSSSPAASAYAYTDCNARNISGSPNTPYTLSPIIASEIIFQTKEPGELYTASIWIAGKNLC